MDAQPSYLPTRSKLRDALKEITGSSDIEVTKIINEDGPDTFSVTVYQYDAEKDIGKFVEIGRIVDVDNGLPGRATRSSGR